MSLAAASCLYCSLSFLLIAHQLPDRIENWVKGPQLQQYYFAHYGCDEFDLLEVLQCL
jgi:hypothetical protein